MTCSGCVFQIKKYGRQLKNGCLVHDIDDFNQTVSSDGDIVFSNKFCTYRRESGWKKDLSRSKSVDKVRDEQKLRYNVILSKYHEGSINSLIKQSLPPQKIVVFCNGFNRELVKKHEKDLIEWVTVAEDVNTLEYAVKHYKEHFMVFAHRIEVPEDFFQWLGTQINDRSFNFLEVVSPDEFNIMAAKTLELDLDLSKDIYQKHCWKINRFDKDDIWSPDTKSWKNNSLSSKGL